MNELPERHPSNHETYLLARLKEMGKCRPSIDNLGEDLFPISLKANELIEIIGDSSTGKTFLILDIIARCILPIQYYGKEATVVLFNLDHKFSIVHFMKVLEKSMIAYTKNSATEFLDGEMKTVVTNSLKRLKIYNCYSDEDFNLSLRNLDQVLFNDYSIPLIVIDSINAFYWLEVKNERSLRLQNRRPTENVDRYHLKIETHYERIISKLTRLSNQYNITIIFTQDEHYANKHQKVLTTRQFNLRKLEKLEDPTDAEQEYEMSISHMKNKFLRRYYLREDGINIINLS